MLISRLGGAVWNLKEATLGLEQVRKWQSLESARPDSGLNPFSTVYQLFDHGHATSSL